MRRRSVLVTGAAGLTGSAVARLFHGRGWAVVGVDNFRRGQMLGAEGDTRSVAVRLVESLPHYEHAAVDIVDHDAVERIVRGTPPDVVVHAAAQPSHDFSGKKPLTDFHINAVATVSLLESIRRFASDAVFVFLSSSKVYGDKPNAVALEESATRFLITDPAYVDGFDESLPIDQSLHSPYGASKVSADVMTQEYGRYYGLRTTVLRPNCITGAAHAAVELHGFLAYLVKRAATDGRYKIIGYEGKQVRDQIHADDLARLVWHVAQRPPVPGTVLNVGGGYDNSVSILEAVRMIEERLGRRIALDYVETPRLGDHVCYYTDMSRARALYPRWRITRPITAILDELIRHHDREYACV